VALRGFRGAKEWYVPMFLL
jgi:hypothetical protein